MDWFVGIRMKSLSAPYKEAFADWSFHFFNSLEGIKPDAMIFHILASYSIFNHSYLFK
jgi:hypothetical protein